MTSYRHSDDRGPRWAGDDSGAYEYNPLERMAAVLDEFEEMKRRVLDTYRDVTAWGGTAQTTGYTQAEWLALVGRLPGRDVWRYDLLTRRLPALPVTATLLTTGQLTLDQAVAIVAGTRRLAGDTLAAVEREAALVALSRNRRGDDPDIDADVDTLVQATKQAAAQDRLDRDRLDRNQARIEPDLFGAGRITEDWADPEGFQTRVAGLESSAGPPSPDTPRSQQLAEGSLAMARAWLAGTPTTGPDVPDHSEDPAAGDGATAPGDTDVAPATAAHPTGPAAAAAPVEDPAVLRPSGARPTLVVRIDVTDLASIDPADPGTLRRLGAGTGAAMGRLAAAGRLSSTPWLGRQLLDTLACNADLTVAIVDGERPLAEFRTTRRLPGRIRRQILWRDLGCRWPGCRSPLAHCDVHHLDQHPTNHDVDNLLALCRKHHRRLHSTFWHPHLDGHTGALELRRSPAGPAVHTTYPRGTRPLAQSPPEVAPVR